MTTTPRTWRIDHAQVFDGTAPLLVRADTTVVAKDGRIAYLGPTAACPSQFATWPRIAVAPDELVTPALVDCHTHAIFAGWRAHEFALRAEGASYGAIAAAGGGIRATLRSTCHASDEVLLSLLHARLTAAYRSGVGCMEIKSGYDLTIAGELRLLRLIATAQATSPVEVVPTLLAHVVPPEVDGAAARADYIAAWCQELIPEVARQRLATSVDVYCDEGAFSLAETAALLRAARDAGLGVRAHLGQFADLDGVPLLCELGAHSVDHLEQLGEGDAARLAAAGVVAVMLPGACVALGLTPPPVAALRAAGVDLAVASDFNPGTSPIAALPYHMHLAMTHYRMSLAETWRGVTSVAARALGLTDRGTLQVGAVADVAIWPGSPEGAALADATRAGQVAQPMALDALAMIPYLGSGMNPRRP